MRKFLLMIIAAMLPAVDAFAEQPRIRKSDQTTASGKQLPLKRGTSANSWHTSARPRTLEERSWFLQNPMAAPPHSHDSRASRSGERGRYFK